MIEMVTWQRHPCGGGGSDDGGAKEVSCQTWWRCGDSEGSGDDCGRTVTGMKSDTDGVYRP